MDQETTLVRRNRWAGVIGACQTRPEGMSIRQWLADNRIPYKTYYYWLRKFRKEAFKGTGIQGQGSCNTSNQLNEIKFDQETSYDVTSNISFKADALVAKGAYTVALSNDASPALIRLLMEVIKDAG